jgi:hypothetical protein
MNSPIDMTGIPFQQAAAAATGEAPPPRFDPQTGQPLLLNRLLAIKRQSRNLVILLDQLTRMRPQVGSVSRG